MTNKSSYKKFILQTIFLALVSWTLTDCSHMGSGCCYDNEDLEKIENKTKYEIKIGDTFQIMLSENSSLGSANCWLNKKRIKSVSLIDTKYYRDGSGDCDGCGGTTVYTFKGVAKGLDSIKIATCPVYIEQKDCSQFSEDSIKVDSLFVVIVN